MIRTRKLAGPSVAPSGWCTGPSTWSTCIPARSLMRTCARCVRETIECIRRRYPERRLWAVFERRSNTSRRSIHQARVCHGVRPRRCRRHPPAGGAREGAGRSAARRGGDREVARRSRYRGQGPGRRGRHDPDPVVERARERSDSRDEQRFRWMLHSLAACGAGAAVRAIVTTAAVSNSPLNRRRGSIRLMTPQSESGATKQNAGIAP